MKKWLVLPLLFLVALAAWVWHRKSQPPVVPFAKVKRETLVSTLPTNGKVEPIEWRTVRTEAAGLVERVPVQEGQMVHAGAVLAQLSQTGLQAELTAAEARVAHARAQLATIEAGGKSAELVEISNQLARARLNRAERSVDLTKNSLSYATLVADATFAPAAGVDERTFGAALSTRTLSRECAARTSP